MDTELTVQVGDITDLKVDAIVNAANGHLWMGEGVAGAIKSKGGKIIEDEAVKQGPVNAGEAVVTTAGQLKAKYVIHAVGPVYRGGQHGEAKLLASAFRRSLEVASANDVRRVAFPSISTGAYRFPIDQAARTALRTVREYLAAHPEIALVRFVLFSDADLAAYQHAAAEILGKQPQ